ncbi:MULTISPECIES: SEC-C metal-binding domain-containing protein [unclassified Sphingobacterium]|uniref:SEC-C metal-binding domain-containing protein n=1 Tax=unclassified Sphingobacterium TaxID=2609468 RepID=UPI00104F0CDA|nr:MULTISPECIES: hypothetical protein [unclassified Sphingobacterium]MCS3556932.1 hypothetical protein [Sphingobacterium sp. JUb21]TCQ98936.1 hypothetical protein EDF66_11646 [Sphingobacterium sp. JUb20]
MNNAYISFTAEANEAIGEFPELQLCVREDSHPYLVGDISLYDENNVVYDKYSIRIECTTEYPASFPYVFETAQRLPHNIDWHVYGDGHFCICTPVEEFIHCSKRITLKGFIKEHVTPYLHNQSFREKEGYFLNERSHGSEGILESIYDLLNTNNVNEAYKLLKFIYNNNTPSRTSMCFCNSGKKYRYCHRKAYQALKTIGQERLLLILNYIK